MIINVSVDREVSEEGDRGSIDYTHNNGYETIT